MMNENQTKYKVVGVFLGFQGSDAMVDLGVFSNLKGAFEAAHVGSGYENHNVFVLDAACGPVASYDEVSAEAIYELSSIRDEIVELLESDDFYVSLDELESEYEGGLRKN